MRVTSEKILIGCGVWLAVLPFTGFPHSWKTVLTVATAAVILYVAVVLWRRSVAASRAVHS